MLELGPLAARLVTFLHAQQELEAFKALILRLLEMILTFVREAEAFEEYLHHVSVHVDLDLTRLSRAGLLSVQGRT